MATAYAALVSLLNNLELIQNHPRHSFSFETKQIQSLLESVLFLIHFMETTDYHSNEAAQVLERRIAFAAHAAEDVIESHVVRQILAGSTLGGKTTSRFLLDLQKAIESMEFVRRKAVKVKALSGFTTHSIAAAAAAAATDLTSQKNSMVGFDKLLDQLLNMLTGNLPWSGRVIPIIGMGGIGKTTLARNAFQHPRIVEHFDICLWATISQQYDVEGIFKYFLSCLSEPTIGTVAKLGESLHKSLYEQRYLIVLDDMWSVEAWNKMMLHFPVDKGNTSRIVVTSRQSDVGSHLASSCFPLGLLDDDKCWDLFCQKVFGEQGCPHELEKVGKKIVRKCRGLPLAIVVVGGHLKKSSRTREYWENVVSHMSTILSFEDNKLCLDVLSLSYRCLPVHLKPCFLYMGTLKEGQKIKATTLFKLWIGEGFLKPSKSHSLEEVAEDYLKDLIDRNLIMATQRYLNGKVEICEIHDVVRELCLKIAGKEKFFTVADTPHAIHRERRAVIHGEIPKEMLQHPRSLNALRSKPLTRSLNCRGGPLLFSSTLLRVVNSVDGAILESDDLHQVNLRYLSCYINSKDYKPHSYFYLPSSISLLWSLQTLIIIKGSIPSIILPYEIWEMLQLRHLHCDDIYLPDLLPSDSDRIYEANLRTLLGVNNFRLSEEVCRRIPKIKELRITYKNECDEAASSHYCPHNLGRLHNLESLNCYFPSPKHSSIGDSCVEGKRLEFETHRPQLIEKFLGWSDFARSLTFPDSLKELSLTESRLSWEELSTMVGSLPHLEFLKLSSNAVIGSEWTTIEGKFNSLKSLVICNCGDLTNLNIADHSHFPALKDVAFLEMSRLGEFPSSIGEIPTLERICLKDCNVPLAMSAMRILVEQEQEYGNQSLQLEVSFEFDHQNHMSFQMEMKKEDLSSDNLRLRGNLLPYLYAPYYPGYYNMPIDRNIFSDENPNACTVM